MIRVAIEIARVGRIGIYCAPENEASVAVPRKMGFLHEATLARRYNDSEGGVHDMMAWTLFADASPDTPASRQDLKAFDCLGRQVL